MSENSMVVGFVGLGTMGGRMAANVQKAGFKLLVHDLHRQAASHHIEAGAIWADSPRALASQADVILSSLPEPADVEAVALGPDGLLAGIRPGAAYFDLSTNSPSVVKAIHSAFAKNDAHMLDAPVSGGPGARHPVSSPSGSAGTKTSSTATRRCSTPSATRPPISGRSAARRWPSSSTTCRAMRSSVPSPRPSPWG